MFSSQFKIKFSLLKALKLKSNVIRNDNTVDGLNIDEKENYLHYDNLDNTFTIKQKCSENSEKDRLFPENIKHLNATVNKYEKNPLNAESVYPVSACNIDNCCCKSFFRDNCVIDNNIAVSKTVKLREINSDEPYRSYGKQFNSKISRINESVPSSEELEKRVIASEVRALHYKKNCNFIPPENSASNRILKDRNYSNASYKNSNSVNKNEIRNNVRRSNSARVVGTPRDIFTFTASASTEPNQTLSDKLMNNYRTSLIRDKIAKFNTLDNSCRTNKVQKVKNMRQVKRLRCKTQRKKTLNRTETFAGYDNFAYRKSMSELNFLKDLNVNDDENPFPKYSLEACPLKRNNNNIISNKREFTVESRMTYYNQPVTTVFHAANPSSDLGINNSIKYSVFNKNSKNAGIIQPVPKLKRHGSFGYFENDSLDHEYILKRRLSLDNLQKVSTSCGIKSIPEANGKLKPSQRENFVDIHLQALFSAVEHGQLEKAKTVLESSEVNVNSVNSDGFSPLDIAVLSNNRPLIKLLIAYGAQDGKKFYSSEDIRSHLIHLVQESEKRVHELGSSLRINELEYPLSTSSSSNIPSITVSDTVQQSKNFSIWEKRTKGLKSMLLGLEQIRPPDSPSSVIIEVTSASSVMVRFQESENKDSPMATKYKVQWSTHKDFLPVCGSFEITDPRQLYYHISTLKRGQCYYVRVSSGNLKGYSSYKTSTPPSVIPSSWHDISVKDMRSASAARIILEDIYNNVIGAHTYLKNTPELYGPGGELLGNPKRKKTTIKQLFTAASKFQKHLRRGVYLSCLLYHEDKVLVTNEDFLPVIEVDETYPKKINTDFHWLFKVAYCWCDLKYLKNDIEKSQNSSAVFRIKLLQAATQMQTALSIRELGKVYHKLLKDTEGTIVISIINYIRSPKSVSVLNLRWLPLAKLIKRTNMMNVESNVGDMLMSSIPDQITYHQVSNIRLPRGLYLGYLKMRSSVESLQVLVPCRAPNIPPHAKIRENPHVTAEEWEWITKKDNLKENLANASYHQRLFVEQVAMTMRRLFAFMEISEEEATYHRIYDSELIEISKDVSLIMVLPPTEAACSVPGQLELLLERPDLLPLTVQVFEMVHFGTYQLDLIVLYSRLSCIIEMDIDLAQHSLRKAFSSAEVSTAKARLADLENLHSQLNSAWKLTRWLLDVISCARDRLSTSTSNIHSLLSIHPVKTMSSNNSHCFLQPPEPKTAKSRGSWPGVGVGRHLGRIPTEMSRSEQQLTSDSMNPHQSNTTISNSKPHGKLQQSSHSQFLFQESSCSSSTRIAPVGSEDALIQLPVSSNSSKIASNVQINSSNTRPDLVSSSDPEIEESITVPVPTPAIRQIYAAYNTGLPCGTSLKLHVSPKTTAREIVELFVKQLNMSVLLKGKDGPVYTADEFPKFCLVAVIGARERCLRDDFKLLQLQDPWKDGRLYVRRKSDVLAAIEHSSKQASTFV